MLPDFGSMRRYQATRFVKRRSEEFAPLPPQNIAATPCPVLIWLNRLAPERCRGASHLDHCQALVSQAGRSET